MSLRLYFEGDGLKLYCGDCADLAVESDLILTDPPYGVEYISGRRDLFGTIVGDGADTGDEIIDRLRGALRGLKHRRHIYVFGALDLSSLNLASHCQLIWDKEIFGMGDLRLPWAPQHESITFGVYSPRACADKYREGVLAARIRHGSVLRAARVSGVGVVHHPTEKPVEILRAMIESSTVLGETVYDPFAGSGSTLIAAAIEGRQAIGCEIDERYCEVAVRRFATEIPRLLVAGNL